MGVCCAFGVRFLPSRPTYARLPFLAVYLPDPAALKHRAGIEKPLRGKCETRQFLLLATDYWLLTTFAFAAKLPHLPFLIFRFSLCLGRMAEYYFSKSHVHMKIGVASRKVFCQGGLRFGRMAEYFLKRRAKPEHYL
jgi:hypothetical protein